MRSSENKIEKSEYSFCNEANFTWKWSSPPTDCKELSVSVKERTVLKAY
jgi:hypothetical protein